MKKKTIRSMKDKAWRVFASYIKIRDCLLTTRSLEYGECITCDFSGHISKLDAGHFIPGRHNANLFSERGVHAQCKTCNGFEGGRPLEYRRQIIKLYGEGADLELEEEARQIKKFTIKELEELMVYYRDKTKALEE